MNDHKVNFLSFLLLLTAFANLFSAVVKEKEFNGDYKNATPFADPKVINDDVGVGKLIYMDEDLWSFTVQKGEEFKIKVEPLTNGDLRIRLLNEKEFLTKVVNDFRGKRTEIINYTALENGKIACLITGDTDVSYKITLEKESILAGAISTIDIDEMEKSVETRVNLNLTESYTKEQSNFQASTGDNSLVDDKSTSYFSETNFEENEIPKLKKFSTNTEIEYTILKESVLEIEIFDVRGVKVTKIKSKNKILPGTYKTKWNGKNSKGQKMQNGIYICKAKSKGLESHKKLLLLK